MLLHMIKNNNRNILLFIFCSIFIITTSKSYAEYYIVRCMPKFYHHYHCHHKKHPSVKKHKKVKHKAKIIHKHKIYKHKKVHKKCHRFYTHEAIINLQFQKTYHYWGDYNQDGTTGDDNPSRHPEMNIDY